MTNIQIYTKFYVFYFAKIVLQKKQSIKTNQMGTGNKPKKVLVIERIMSAATVLMLHMQILQEEEHMQRMFGEEYEEYRKRTARYFGRR